MPQRHLDRLTPVDAAFLHQEGPVSHMHIGWVTIVEGPPPTMEQFLEEIRRRLHLVPRYRQKLAYTVLDSGRPVWIDDPSFNLEYHIRHTALPAPGRWEQLQDLTARIFSQQLDRSKPMWEMWLIEGLEDGRFTLITKTHHSLNARIEGVDIATVLFAVVTGAMRSFPIDRGRRTEGVELRALVPVSVRVPDERGETGNRLVVM